MCSGWCNIWVTDYTFCSSQKKKKDGVNLSLAWPRSLLWSLVFRDGAECSATCCLKRGCCCDVNQALPCRSFCLLGTCVRRCRSSPDCCTVPRNPYCRTRGTADRWPSLLLAVSCAARHRKSWLEQIFALIIGKNIICDFNRWQILWLCSGNLGNKKPNWAHDTGSPLKPCYLRIWPKILLFWELKFPRFEYKLSSFGPITSQCNPVKMLQYFLHNP